MLSLVGGSPLLVDDLKGKIARYGTIQDLLDAFHSTQSRSIIISRTSRFEQRRDDVALQKIDDCHAVVGGDEDPFSH